MNEQRLRRRQPPLPLSSLPPPSPPAAFSPESMPIATSQPNAPSNPAQSSLPPDHLSPPSASPAPEAGVPRPLSSKPPPSSSTISISDPRLDPASSAAIVDSAADPDPPTTTATEPSGPAKIPCRPRKTRKLAASFSPAGQGRAGEGGVAASSPVGDGNGACAPVMISNHARAVYRLPPRPLSADGEVAAAIRHLRAADPQLAGVIDAHQPPVFQSLHPPFHALARSILYQQLALKAAASIYSRFLALCGGENGVVPQVVLALTPQQLRQIGVSARKASYLHDLANKYRNGILSDASIAAMDDKSLFTMLNMVKGIGAWSVHMFMIFSLHRPDVLPVGDVGVRKGVQLLYGLDALPRPSQMEQLCERWKPYRSVGSWCMWRLVEAKGVPAALATVSSGVAVAAAADGGGVDGGTSLVVRVPSPLPAPHLQLQMLQQYRPQHPHLQQHQHLHPPQHPPHLQQHQHQHQLQIRPQLIDAMQSIPNLG
ncbi:hypothetical protein Taro_036292 [Colocasia esculenta]|uniref:HhH-GPD domain-containing protein n=1 Tax=Colocasia esculenta TaxID=4460 RepID=A0A843W171_COLES|nr:hypothetical protein [Colocasia esculenta]